MKQSTRNKLVTELTNTIDKWLDNLDCLDMPFMPDDVAFLMASNAILILDLMDRAEQSMRDAGMIKEDE